MDFCLGFHIISGDYWGGASSAKAALPSFLGRAAHQNASVVGNAVRSVVTKFGLRSDGSLPPHSDTCAFLKLPSSPYPRHPRYPR